MRQGDPEIFSFQEELTLPYRKRVSGKLTTYPFTFFVIQKNI